MHSFVALNKLNKLSVLSGATTKDSEAITQGNKVSNSPKCAISDFSGPDSGLVPTFELSFTFQPAFAITYSEANL